MSKDEIKVIPEPSLRRLVHYHHLVKDLIKCGAEEISSATIARELYLDSIQVRKDIQFTGIVGKPKRGYNAKELLAAIETVLNWNNTFQAFLVGCGKLGRAMLHYPNFTNYGLEFVAAFDVNPDMTDTRINGISVLHTEQLVKLAKRMHIHLGVITTPAEAAQEAADLMIEGGIEAIWNFAPSRLKVPENVIVENAQFSETLGVLTNKLKNIGR